VSDERPDPDALLQRVKRDEAEAKHGRLKVFFGAAPGVGKTYAMLQAAHVARDAGQDVVIGWVETHRRAETAALADGFERLPPREVEHRGVRLVEFDIDAALARKPALLLLDELAHTNAPGSRHPKRWQDARELIEAGVDVWTTLNVQHLESVNDLVERITGVIVRETLPDRLLDEADEVEIVDLPTEDLLKRLAEGKVYLPDQAARAVAQFFRKGNLTALRELALRRTAEHVDAAVQDYRRDHAIEATWPVTDRILVCIRPNPDSGRLVRAARRLATRLRAPWIAAWVESPGQPPLSAEERVHLAAALGLAEQLGAETATVSGASVPEAVLQLARERNVSQIVVGKPGRAGWRGLFRGSLVDAIVKQSGELDVFIVSGDLDQPAPPAWPKPRTRPPGYAKAVAVVAAASLLSWALLGESDRLNLAMVYLLGVVFVATRYGRGPSVLAAVLSVAVFDFLFIPPHLTFAVSDTQYLVSFAVMLVVGLLVSTLAARVRDAAEFARQRERRTQALYALVRELLGPRQPREIAAVAARHVAELMRCETVVLLPAASGPGLEPAGEAVPAFARDPRELAVARWAFDHRQTAGADTDTLPAGAVLYEPLAAGEDSLGVLGIRLEPALRPLPPDQRELVGALARQIAGPLERARLADRADAARLAAESERLRSTLLSSVSHDLRTPLAAITGAASGLLVEPPPAPELRLELASTVLDEAQRLNRLVGNLLDMTRLEAGTLEPKRDWHSLEELIGSAIARVEGYARGCRFAAEVAPELPLVPIDAVLVEQALVNLLENAVRHAGAGVVRVAARRDGAEALVEVTDEGPGLPADGEERVFDKFYRAAGGPGAGLGLAIARAIVTAHGGRIWAENLTPRGAAFRFTLPLGDAPPPPPLEELA